MHKPLAARLAFVLLLLLTSPLPGLSDDREPEPTSIAAPEGRFFRSQGQRVEGEYIVVFERAVAPRDQALALAGAAGARVDRVWKHAVNGALFKNMTAARARALLAHPNVRYVEENGVISLSATQYNPPWGLDRVDQHNLPRSGAYTYDFDGSGVHVYILDTGIRPTHSQFGNRASADYDSMNDGQNGIDCNGHGTHVAGTVGGVTYGVAKNARLHGIRVLNCAGSSTIAAVLDGIDWVTANHVAPAVANMSLGGTASTVLDEAVNTSVAAGVFYAVAAGNENTVACLRSPARAAGSFTVGSTAISEYRSGFSNYGTCVDLFAPGSSIPSAWYTSDTAIATISGTSMATPHVAGAAALVLDESPAATPAEVAQTLLDRATPGVVVNAGNGSPNLLLYTRADDAPPPPPPPTPELQNGVPITGLSANLSTQPSYRLAVPEGVESLSFTISGGSGATGDADLYVKYGSLPTTADYDCRPQRSGHEESCFFSTVPAGNWYVLVRPAFSSFSGVTLIGSYLTGATDLLFQDDFASGTLTKWSITVP